MFRDVSVIQIINEEGFFKALKMKMREQNLEI